MDDTAHYCADLVREQDRDRYLATLFAPAGKRDALFALYAFNSEIARVRGVAREPMAGEVRLQWWREVLEGTRDGEAAAHPVASALLKTIAQTGLSAERLMALIEAREADLYDDAPATGDDFDNYAVLTQSSLLAMAAGLLGAEGLAVGMLARHAGIALAITGTLVALPRMVARGQMPVPLDLLTRNGVSADDVRARRDTPALRSALAQWRGKARRQMTEAASEAPQVPQQALPALLPLALVLPQLRPMDRRGYEPFAVEPLSRLRRQWLLWRASRKPERLFAR